MNNSNQNLADAIKHRLWLQGLTLKDWGEQYGYTGRQVWDVVNGATKARYGRGREIKERLTSLMENTHA